MHLRLHLFQAPIGEASPVWLGNAEYATRRGSAFSNSQRFRRCDCAAQFHWPRGFMHKEARCLPHAAREPSAAITFPAPALWSTAINHALTLCTAAVVRTRNVLTLSFMVSFIFKQSLILFAYTVALWDKNCQLKCQYA